MAKISETSIVSLALQGTDGMNGRVVGNLKLSSETQNLPWQKITFYGKCAPNHQEEHEQLKVSKLQSCSPLSGSPFGDHQMTRIFQIFQIYPDPRSSYPTPTFVQPKNRF